MADEILDEFHREWEPTLSVAFWPDESISFIRACSHSELWDLLDKEGDPNECRVTEYDGGLPHHDEACLGGRRG